MTSSRDDNLGLNGSVYLFNLRDGIWKEQQKINEIGGLSDNFFGGHLALTENIALIGSAYDNDLGRNSGSVYVYSLAEDLIYKNAFE